MFHFNDIALFELGYIVLNACVSKWGISYEVMSKIIEKYELMKYLSDNAEFLNERGLPGIVIEVERYLKEEGGSIEKFL